MIASVTTLALSQRDETVITRIGDVVSAARMFGVGVHQRSLREVTMLTMYLTPEVQQTRRTSSESGASIFHALLALLFAVALLSIFVHPRLDADGVDAAIFKVAGP